MEALAVNNVVYYQSKRRNFNPYEEAAPDSRLKAKVFIGKQNIIDIQRHTRCALSIHVWLIGV